MLSTGNNIARITPFSVSTVHIRTSCGAKETGQIRRLSESVIPIREWISYVEPEHINAKHIKGPTRNIVRPYDPPRGYPFDCTPRGAHFIMAGSLAWLPSIFEKICDINYSRYEDMEFHSSMDLVGSWSTHPLTDKEKEPYLLDPSGPFCAILDAFQAQRNSAAKIYFDGGEARIRILGDDRKPKTSLYWHSTLEKMMEHILGANK